MRAVVIVHPGKVGDRQAAQRRLAEVADQVGCPMPRWIETSAEDPGPGHARAALDDGAELVLVWGGDGTMVGVAGAVAGSGVPLGILPGGTANLLARNLGIPLDVTRAAHVALAGDDRRIDLLEVDLGHGEKRVSTVMTGTGWDAEMMAAPEARKRRLGWGAYAIEGARGLRMKPMDIRISVDGGPEQHVTGRTVLVANVGMLVAGLHLVPQSTPDDGMLDVLVIDPTSPLDWVRTTAGIISRTGWDNDPSRLRFRSREVRFSTGHVRRRQIDGDLVTPGAGMHVRTRPGALVVRVP